MVNACHPILTTIEQISKLFYRKILMNARKDWLIIYFKIFFMIKEKELIF